MKTSKPFNFLFTISGSGKRFQEAGFELPKPLIPVKDKLMIEWAAKSCDFLEELDNKKLIFTVRPEHISGYGIDKILVDKFGSESVIIPVYDKWPRGQAGHALAAKEYINNESPLFICCCDTFCRAPSREIMLLENPDGIIPCFETTEDRFSFAKLDNRGYVCETAEKIPISNLATTGHYYFKRGSDFVKATEEMIEKGDNLNGEYYVAPVYNYLVKNGGKIRVAMTTENWVMGTPSELEHFLKSYPHRE